MEEIFSGFGIEIIKRDEKTYIRYDDGELVVHMTEKEITEKESIKAQRSERDAYDVILVCERMLKKSTS